jgi:hypothetical protein
MKTTIAVHFVARSRSIICKSYIPSVCFLIQKNDNRKTNLRNKCVRESLQKNCQVFQIVQSRTTQQPLHTPTSRNNPRDMQQQSFKESF